MKSIKAEVLPPVEDRSASAVASDRKALITVREAARAAGMSEATVRRAINEGIVQPVREGRNIFIRQTSIIELQTGAIKRPPTLLGREVLNARGELAANVFRLLDEGYSPKDIVQDLRADPPSVRGLVEEWLKCQELQARLTALREGGPQFNHAPSKDWDCCDGHRAAKASQGK